MKIDPSKLQKLHLYKTAFSPLYNAYVGIREVHQLDNGTVILYCNVVGLPDDQMIIFRPHELRDYVL